MLRQLLLGPQNTTQNSNRTPFLIGLGVVSALGTAAGAYFFRSYRQELSEKSSKIKQLEARVKDQERKALAEEDAAKSIVEKGLFESNGLLKDADGKIRTTEIAIGCAAQFKAHSATLRLQDASMVFKDAQIALSNLQNAAAQITAADQDKDKGVPIKTVARNLESILPLARFHSHNVEIAIQRSMHHLEQAKASQQAEEAFDEVHQIVTDAQKTVANTVRAIQQASSQQTLTAPKIAKLEEAERHVKDANVLVTNILSAQEQMDKELVQVRNGKEAVLSSSANILSLMPSVRVQTQQLKALIAKAESEVQATSAMEAPQQEIVTGQVQQTLCGRLETLQTQLTTVPAYHKALLRSEHAQSASGTATLTPLLAKLLRQNTKVLDFTPRGQVTALEIPAFR